MNNIADLLDIYKREINSDLLALKSIGKRISGKKDIQIEFNRYDNEAFTNGQKICLPRFCKTEIKPAQGFIAHESGHIGYGSFEIGFLNLIQKLGDKYNVPGIFVKHIINIVEDVRVNVLNKQEFPGFYRNLRNYTLKILPEIKAKIKSFENIFLYINLFMEDYPQYQKKPDFHRFPLRDKEWETIHIVKELLLKALTPNASIIATDQLCKILKKYFNFRECVPNQQKPYHSGRVSTSDYVGRNGYIGTNHRGLNERPKQKRVVFLPNHFEDFTNKEIEEKHTKFSKSSKKMIDKIDKIDLSDNDLKRLTDKISGINKDNKEDKKQKIGHAIDETLKGAPKISKKPNGNLENVRKSLEMMYSDRTDAKIIENEEKNAEELFKTHYKRLKEQGKEEIKREQEEASEFKNILDEFENLNEENNGEKQSAKKKALSEKVKRYQQKKNENSTNRFQNEKEKRVLDNLRDFIDGNDEGTNQITKKKEAITKSLQKTYRNKTSTIEKKKKALNEDLRELKGIVNSFENIEKTSNLLKKRETRNSILEKIK